MPLLTRAMIVAGCYSALAPRSLNPPLGDDDDDQLLKGPLDLNDAVLVANAVGGPVNPNTNNLFHEDENIMNCLDLSNPVHEESFDHSLNDTNWGILRMYVEHTDPRDAEGGGMHFVAVKKVTITGNEFRYLLLGGEENAEYLSMDHAIFRWLFGDGRVELIRALSSPFGGIDAATIT